MKRTDRFFTWRSSDEIEGLSESILYCNHDEYVDNVPSWIQDIVYLHNYRNSLPENNRYLFDWWCQYKSGGIKIIGAELSPTTHT